MLEMVMTEMAADDCLMISLPCLLLIHRLNVGPAMVLPTSADLQLEPDQDSKPLGTPN